MVKLIMPGSSGVMTWFTVTVNYKADIYLSINT